MNRLSNQDRRRVLACVVEVKNIRATVRISIDGPPRLVGYFDFNLET